MKATLEAVFATLQEDPTVSLLVWGKENPTAFYQLASKLIPIESKTQITVPREMSDIERASRIASILNDVQRRKDEAEADSASK